MDDDGGKEVAIKSIFWLLQALDMTVEEQIVSWRTVQGGSFAGPSQRAPKYHYSLRRMHGMEGQRLPQQGWSCARIQVAVTHLSYVAGRRHQSLHGHTADNA